MLDHASSVRRFVFRDFRVRSDHRIPLLDYANGLSVACVPYNNLLVVMLITCAVEQLFMISGARVARDAVGQHSKR